MNHNGLMLGDDVVMDVLADRTLRSWNLMVAPLRQQRSSHYSMKAPQLVA
jgi:predicted HAD superfamily phosphohydrolase YqeG